MCLFAGILYILYNIQYLLYIQIIIFFLLSILCSIFVNNKKEYYKFVILHIICISIICNILFDIHFNMDYIFNFGIILNNLYFRNVDKFIYTITIIILLLLLKKSNMDDGFILDLPILICLCVIGSIIIIYSNNLFIFYLGLELQSLCIYVIIGSKNYCNLAVEASLRYFIIGSFASCLILCGISLIYMYVGIIDFKSI